MDDYAEECREAFRHHCDTRAGIDPDEPTKRNENTKRRARLVADIDEILDDYNEWLLIAPYDLPTPTEHEAERTCWRRVGSTPSETMPA